MAFRGSRDSVYEERDRFYERQERRSPPRRAAPVREYEETDIRVRERERDSDSRVPSFMRDERARDAPAGPLVLRQREVETVDRRRPRSPSPVRYRERIVQRARSLTPPPPPPMERERIEVRDRVIERNQSRVRSPSRGPSMDRLRARFVDRSPSPPERPVERVRTRFVERERSPTPVDREREIRIIERERERERLPSPSPSPPLEPPVIRGPTIEREVITHYRDIDHGMIVARPPSPPPPPRPRVQERDTEIDITTSRHRTEVDIHESSRERRGGGQLIRVPTRGRSISRERPAPARRSDHYHEDDVMVVSDRNRLEVDIEHRHGHSSSRSRHRRAHSAAPPVLDYDDEAEYITSRINERGRMGEAWHGHTKDWTIVDVPPGTERVRMDGVGGGGADVTWSRYNGVRRAKFVPERDGSDVGPTTSSTSLSERDVVRTRERGTDRLSVQIYDKDRDRDREIDVIADRQLVPVVPNKRSDMWTEITKDLVVREAIEEMGYEYEETEWFFYVMQYLRYEDVLELVERSDRIRRIRKDRIREIQWERDYRDGWERRHRHHHHGRFNDERVVEREVIYDRREPRYLR
ncbi:uncharacterized protein E0L32_005608 [Thyridium curvatum]|uniref:DUF8035 domain-containing protein n=1 Tax=Thyridium curvatum TaxID=1093900 RepID=A0A507BAS7_9PEZI|nr:uncharacterized protein E0L32_005608 [Thyridium curvatum]TPX13908.1 hypothetical protein E0L32_005608 [Thyridium curvatum]